MTGKPWRITIDQISGTGGFQRHGPYTCEAQLMSDAVEDAIEQAGFLHVEHGHYQITVTDPAMSPERAITAIEEATR